MLNTYHHHFIVNWTSVADMQEATSGFLEICKSNSSQAIINSTDKSASSCDQIYNDPLNFALGSTWHIVSKLPFLFYLVWPTQTMFSSLDQVPRYVTEVSAPYLPPYLSSWPQPHVFDKD